jgi:hypothetical protein
VKIEIGHRKIPPSKTVGERLRYCFRSYSIADRFGKREQNDRRADVNRDAWESRRHSFVVRNLRVAIAGRFLSLATQRAKYRL